LEDCKKPLKILFRLCMKKGEEEFCKEFTCSKII